MSKIKKALNLKNITKHYQSQKKRKEQNISLNKTIRNQMIMTIIKQHLVDKGAKTKLSDKQI